MMTLKIKQLCVASALCFTINAQAQTLFTITASTASSTTSYDNLETGITAGTITATNGFLFTADSTTDGDPGQNSANGIYADNNVGTVGPSTYNFTFTVDAGFTATINDLDFEYTLIRGGGLFHNSPRSADFSGDIDGIALAFSNPFSQDSTKSWLAVNPTISGGSFVLNEGTYSINITASESTDQSGFFVAVRDIELSGTVSAIPEPSTWASLLGIGLLTAAMIHRRRA